ncbi:cytochrome P450 [Obba rivulosa]|uniref:Cytochrome P450 n=1 Tax=Obba rivulosa TaxID=1052685 RepID=A0A8E2AZ82_9APHY|nr:cytochrome P450 [Obba rivulosa]
MYMRVRTANLKRRSTLPLPPGPRGLPIIGNLLDMPTHYQWKTFARWSEEYGDLISVKVLGQTYILLNSLEHVIELFERRGAIYSDRPTLTVCGEIAGWGRTTIMSHYDDRLRNLRRLFTPLFGTRKNVEQFVPVLEEQSHRFLLRLKNNPDDLEAQVRKSAGALILAISHGYCIREENDHLITISRRANDDFAALTVPGAFAADFLPILKHVPAWFPGAGWKRFAQNAHRNVDAMHDAPHKFVKQQMAAGTATPSFASLHLSDCLTPDEEALVKDAAGSIYGAGSDTTVSAICSFFLAMTCYPEIQRKAQLEIDTVIGTDSLPNYSDRERLPYVNALLLEVVRWNPVVPLGGYRCLTQNDVYGGYAFPKGAYIIPNVWKYLHDPEAYTDPFQFNPGRFLPSGDKKPEKDPRTMAFGFGRRACPGMKFADASIFMTIARSLAAFEISKKVENGQVLQPAQEYTSGIVSHPKLFPLSVKPRSAKMEALINTVHSDQP